MFVIVINISSTRVSQSIIERGNHYSDVIKI